MSRYVSRYVCHDVTTRSGWFPKMTNGMRHVCTQNIPRLCFPHAVPRDELDAALLCCASRVSCLLYGSKNWGHGLGELPHHASAKQLFNLSTGILQKISPSLPFSSMESNNFTSMLRIGLVLKISSHSLSPLYPRRPSSSSQPRRAFASCAAHCLYPANCVVVVCSKALACTVSLAGSRCLVTEPLC